MNDNQLLNRIYLFPAFVVKKNLIYQATFWVDRLFEVELSYHIAVVTFSSIILLPPRGKPPTLAATRVPRMKSRI
jgi:hypothetical protein